MLRVKYLILPFILLICFLLGWYVRSIWTDKVSEETEIDVVVSSFQEVLKLSTVEMPLSEILSHKKHNTYDWDIFSGKLIYKATGKVVAGIDMELLNIEVDSTNKIIYLNRNPTPEILYIECDISYYDIQEGLFFSFESEDFNEIQKIGKEALSEAARSSDILSIAEERSIQIISHFEVLLQAAGWQVQHRPGIEIPDYLRN